MQQQAYLQSNSIVIKIDTLCEHVNNANTYVVSSGEEAIVIDPANDIRSIKTLLKNKKLVGVLLTHGHFDHFSTINKMLTEFNCPYYMHKNAYSKLKNVDTSCARYFGCNAPVEIDETYIKFVSEGVKINIAGLDIKCLYKPGHTDCSIVFQIENNLFTGDFLFKGSVGRCDLPTGNNLIMRKSLSEIKTFKKEEDFVIYPGHGESTLLSEELKTNYYLLRF